MPYTETLAENYLQAKEAERVNAQSGEDPLLTAIAGDSKEFVGKMPKEVWDQMSPEAQKRWTTIPEEHHDNIRGLGSVAGAAPGMMLGTINPWVGGALAVYGGSRGYDAADKWLKNDKPTTMSREQLQRQFESVKGQE
ncbi:MAG: hypothetical protein ACLGSA_05930 [Acidobacteriota bacterium]